MVSAVLLRLCKLQDGFGEIVCERRTPILIRHDTDAAGFTGLFENRFNEVLAVKSVEPRGADDEVLGAESAHEDFARPFRTAVGVDGANGIGFLAGRGIGAGKDIVGGNV